MERLMYSLISEVASAPLAGDARSTLQGRLPP
jgi:hypothetical protein